MAEATCPHCLTSYAAKEVETTRVAKCRKCGQKFRVYPKGFVPGKKSGKSSAPSEIVWDKKPVVERELTRAQWAWLAVGASAILLVSAVVIYEVFFV
ncbi:MAG: hypothetical protein ACIAXF_00235 [Phycisphaerales bacterium JB063]